MDRKKLIDFRGDRSQSAMAAIYGVSQQAWCMWEKGRWKPNVITMKRLEMDSGIAMEELFPDVFNKKNLFKSKEATA